MCSMECTGEDSGAGAGAGTGSGAVCTLQCAVCSIYYFFPTFMKSALIPFTYFYKKKPLILSNNKNCVF